MNKAVGDAVLTGLTSVMLVSMLLDMAIPANGLISSLLLGWAGIEAMAAFVTLIENEVRFLR